MPKKTKKEKLVAERRRKNTPAHPSVHTAVSTSTEKAPSLYQFHISSQKKIHQMESDDKAELITIKHDLAKTLVLAIIAIGIEVSLYWLLHVK